MPLKEGPTGRLTEIAPDPPTSTSAKKAENPTKKSRKSGITKNKQMFYRPVGKDQISGEHQIPDSAPATTHTPEAYRDSADLTPKAAARKINSTPVAGRVTKRFLEENSLPAPLNDMASFNFATEVPGPKTAGMQPDAMIYGEGMNPTKTGTYGAHLQVQVKEGMNRVASQQGIVESVDDESQGGAELGSSDGHHSNRSTFTNPYSENNTPIVSLPGFAYSKGTYTGTWENNPAVGRSLPPFSPTVRIPKRADAEHSDPGVKQSRGIASGSSDHSKESIPVGYNPGENPMLRYQPQIIGTSTGAFMFNPSNNHFNQTGSHLLNAQSFASNPNDGQPQPQLANARSFESNSSWAKNSWAAGRPSNLHNSWVPSNPRQSAVVPPLFANDRTNSVPAPPTGFAGYEPNIPVSPELTYVEAKLHFHIDTCYEALRRLIISKNDRVIDEVIKRTEKVEERVDKSFRGTSRHFHEVQEEVKQTMGRATKDNGPNSQETLVRLGNMEDRMNSVGNEIQHVGNNVTQLKDRVANLQDRVANLGDQMTGLTMQVNGALSVPRITSTGSSGSAYVPTRGESVQSLGNIGRARGTSFQRREGSATPSTPRRSTSNQQQGLRRLNTNPIDASEGRRSQYADIRRDQFQEFGRTFGPEPDITMHPAYAMNQQGFPSADSTSSAQVSPSRDDESSVMFPRPSYTNGGWYEHAHPEE